MSRSRMASATVGLGKQGYHSGTGIWEIDQGGRMTEAVVQDFEQVLGLVEGGRIAQPVVKDKQVGTRPIQQ